MDEYLATRIKAAFQNSAEGLSDEIYRILESGDVGTISKNDPPSVELARALSAPSLAAGQARLRVALVNGAQTWNPPIDRPDVCAGVALLFRRFSSRELAISLSQRLLGDTKQHQAISSDGPYVDLLLDAILTQATDPTVRSRCVDLVFDQRFERFLMTIFIRLTKIDATTIPFIVERVLDCAPSFPKLNGRPGYIIAFDRDLNLSDIDNIMTQLPPARVHDFSKNFLAFSWRFNFVQGGLIEVIDAPDTDPSVYEDYGPLVLEDEQRGGTLKLGSQAAILQGRLEFLRENRQSIFSEMAALGLRAGPLLVA